RLELLLLRVGLVEVLDELELAACGVGHGSPPGSAVGPVSTPMLSVHSFRRRPLRRAGRRARYSRRVPATTMPDDFALTEDALDDDRHLVAVRGDLDLHTAPELREALARAIDEGRSRLVVDLTETSYMDSSGLTALVLAHKRVRKRSG